MDLSLNERKKIEEELAKTKTVTAGVVKTISRLATSLVEFKERCYKTMSEVRTAADMIINEVRTHEEKLVAQVQEIIELRESFVEQQKKVLEEYIAELQQSIDYTSDVLNIPTSPTSTDVDEWKTALQAQLQDLNKMSENYSYTGNLNDEAQFLFIYAKEGLLKSIANYGTIVTAVPDGFRLKQDDIESYDRGYRSEIVVIPVVTLNGAILDLDRAINESDEELSDDDDDDDDDSDDDDEDDDVDNDSGDKDDDYDDNDDDDSSSSDTDYDAHKSSDRNEDSKENQCNLKSNIAQKPKPKLSTLL